ncbi:N-acetylmuramoyl-L-alanine amidase [Streptomyces sp. TRM68367]|uniref:N-acetylmuramoyl-L-alanine amidase n=1 Tax=Streptomyces sp. TRM68367 TaxID=2758415 RepID=UPI0029342A20|nr:N-acetylmuramoyl-L-alanine amidase [Streptomyces sp. TRM68367]
MRGAHTYGFNGISAGISLLGDYENGGTPTTAAKQAIADLAAWKLGLDGVDPQAKVTLTAAGDTGVYQTGEKATLNTISGHRDGYATLCPGQKLYDALPEIRYHRRRLPLRRTLTPAQLLQRTTAPGADPWPRGGRCGREQYGRCSGRG